MYCIQKGPIYPPGALGYFDSKEGHCKTGFKDGLRDSYFKIQAFNVLVPQTISVIRLNVNCKAMT